MRIKTDTLFVEETLECEDVSFDNQRSGSESDTDNLSKVNRDEISLNKLDLDGKTLTENKLGNLIPRGTKSEKSLEHDPMDGDEICDDLPIACARQQVAPQIPVKVLAANLQQFYSANNIKRSMAIDRSDSRVKKDEKAVTGKPPQVPRKPTVISHKYVTKVDISSHKRSSHSGTLSKEDAEAMDVLDKSIEMSERQPLRQPLFNKGSESQSDNLIEEIVVQPGARNARARAEFFDIANLNIRSDDEDMLARRRHELAKHEITGLLDCRAKSPSDIDEAIDDEILAMEPRACSSNSTDSGVPECRDPLLVAAIDLGTTYSGYAFSFTRDPDNIRVMKKSESFWIHKHKKPTCLLLKPTGEFYSFGFNAQMNYHDLESSDDKQNWMYFDKFKMELHNAKNLSLDSELVAVNGKKIKAITIFTYVLRYFKELVLEELSDSTGTKISNDDVRWVITVPAIWRQPAKQFMRTAAYQAGLASKDNPNQIMIALEPEAASLYCRRLKLEQLIQDDDARLSDHSGDEYSINEMQNRTLDSMLAKGTRYMVVDCGGGTVDITVYEVENSSGFLRELHKATGGPHGSVGVDKQFELLLQKIFGTEFIDDYKREVPEGYVYLMLKFESRKLCATTNMTKPLNIELPYTFIQAYQKYVKDMTDLSVMQKAVENSGVEGVFFSSTGMLRMNPEVMLQLFKPTIGRIKEHISEVLLQPRVCDVNYLFLVGGFAESQILQSEIRARFSKILTVIIPRDVSISILQGAVLFGLDPSVVSVRCSRMTYGVGILNHFDPTIHPLEKLIIKDDVQWCTDVFDKFVSCNQPIELGETVSRSYTPASSGQKFLVLHVYMSEDENPKFITDPGVLRCGTLALDLRDSLDAYENESREIQAIMTFGDTEIKANAVDITTKKSVDFDIDFLT